MDTQEPSPSATMKYGIVVIQQVSETKGYIVHFCGYDSEPDQNTVDTLMQELLIDPAFRLDLDPSKLIWRLASSVEIEHFRNIMKNSEEGIEDPSYNTVYHNESTANPA